MPKSTLRFAAGQVTDRPRHSLPAQAVWEANDVFLQEDGTLAQRGGAINAQSLQSTISPAHWAALQSYELDAILRTLLYDDSNGSGGNIRYQSTALTPPTLGMTPSAPAAVTDGGIATANGGGRPARYLNRILRPNGIPATAAANNFPFSIWGGGPFLNLTRTSASTPVVTANDSVVTGFSAADTAAIDVGSIIRITKSGTNVYVGRVVAIPSSTTLQVSPTPTVTFTGTASAWTATAIGGPLPQLGGITWINGARCLTTWSDRVVLGGTSYDVLGAHTKLEVRANEIAYGLLPAAVSGENVIGGITFDGMFEGSPHTFLAKDAFRIPGLEAIIGLEPVNQGELLVLGQPRCYRIVGFLSTQTTQAGGGLTFEARPLQDAVFAISDAATATTPIGIFFAGTDGIYLYRDGRATNIMDKRIKNEWLTAIQGGATVTGGGYLNNHTYYVSLTDRTYVVDFDQFRWSKWSIFGIGQPLIDPVHVGRIYSFRKNAGTSLTSDKFFRLDSTLYPAAAVKADVFAWSGSPVPATRVQTQAFTAGDEEQIKRWQHVWVTVRAPNGGSVRVTMMPGVDSEETQTVLTGNISGTGANTLHFPIAINSRALAVKIEPVSNPDEMEIVAVKLGWAPLSEYRTA